MLYDRDYMRGGNGSYLRSPVVVLLITLAFLFLVECVMQVYVRTHTLADWFSVSASGMARHEYYRLLTFQFIHDAPWPWHLLMNGIGLWFFGQGVLEAQGNKRFWMLYLAAGTVGGLVDLACQAWHPRYGVGGTIGASGNVLGLAAAFCLMNPGRDIVFFLYVIPVRMRAITVFWVLFGFSVFGLIFPFGGVSHAAHLGGLLAGVAFARIVSDDGALDWLSRLGRSRPILRPEFPVTAGKHRGPAGPTAGSEGEPVTPDEYIRREVDPILDKILAHGPQSLTEKERRILEQAPKRLRKD